MSGKVDYGKNAQRLEDIANNFEGKIHTSSRYYETSQYVMIVREIDSQQSIIRFALNVYANDLLATKASVRQRLERIDDSNKSKTVNESKTEADKAFFLSEFCKTDNIDKLLENIEDFMNHDMGRKPPRMGE